MQLRNQLLRLVVASTALISAAAHAGTGQGLIQPNWNVFTDGNLFFYLGGTHTGSPCSIPERWAFDTTTPVGKSFYAAFLVAYTSGKAVQVYGSGLCTHDNSESVSDFHVIN